MVKELQGKTLSELRVENLYIGEVAVNKDKDSTIGMIEQSSKATQDDQLANKIFILIDKLTRRSTNMKSLEE